MKRVLKASAGTGKTFRLSLEYIAALLSGQDFREIVVLTFTRKATAEARERILEHLSSLEADGERSLVWQEIKKIYPDLRLRPEVISSCRRRMLLEKDSIHIYTIDSFINQLFGDIVAPCMGVYDYEIIEPEQNEPVSEEVFRRLLQRREYFTRLEDILQLRVTRNHQKPLNFVRSVLAERWKYLLIEHEEREPLTREKFLPPLEEAVGLLRQIAREKGKTFDGDWLISDFTDIILEYEKMKEGGVSPEERREFIYKYRSDFLKRNKTFWNGTKTRGRDYEPLVEEMEMRYDEFRRALAADIFNEEIIPLESGLFQLTDIIFAEYDKLKLRQQKFTYSDISNYVYKYMIRGDLEIPVGELDRYFSRITGEEIRSLFIDEFQDTSVLQWKILEPFVEGERDFIAVGDAKQSIYQWRGGEKELFHRLPGLISSPEENLSICYRSDREILRFVNDFFSDLSRDWDYEPVLPREEADRGYVEVRLGGSGARINEDTKKFASYGQEKQERIREQNELLSEDLPREIARRISQDFDSLEGVAVLARKNDQLREIAGYLDEFSLPYVLHQQRDLLQNKAVWPLYQLLNFIWQNDFHHLLNFLRSDLIRLPQEQLKFMLVLREELQQILSRARQEEDETILAGSELLTGRGELCEVLEWVISLIGSDFTEMSYKLIAESGAVTMWQEDLSALKNIYRFYRLLGEHDSLPEFMEAARQEGDTTKFQEAAVQVDDAVDLLTIHKAKGLSFHSELFYWKPGGPRGGSRTEELELHLEFAGDYSHIESYLLTTDHYSDVLHWLDYEFETEAGQEHLMEEINNIYVAMTRASRNLLLWIESPAQILPGEEEGWKHNSDRYNFYEPALQQACNVKSLTELISGKSWGVFETPRGSAPADEAEFEDVAVYLQPDDLSQEERSRQMARKRDISLDLNREKERIMGLALHYYLEQIKYGLSDEKRTARKLVSAKYGNILGDELTAEALERAESFIAENPDYFSRRWEVFTEYAINSAEDGEESSRIDRLLLDREQEEILIVDYKSGEIREEAQLERYRQKIMDECGSRYSIRTEFATIKSKGEK